MAPWVTSKVDGNRRSIQLHTESKERSTSHVLPGLDAQAADTVARRILGGGDQEPTRPVDNPSTDGRKAAVGGRR